jgi:hypothetical protein
MNSYKELLSNVSGYLLSKERGWGEEDENILKLDWLEDRQLILECEVALISKKLAPITRFETNLASLVSQIIDKSKQGLELDDTERYVIKKYLVSQ